ncbi:MAG: GTA-gp10 family protein [Pseudomonadota bacterium]
MTTPNPQRGDVALTVNGQVLVLRLTLGALAALEARLQSQSLIDLAEHFESGRVSAADLLALLAAGLEGAGTSMTEQELADAEIEGGAVAAMKAGIALLSAAFGTGTSDAS